MGEVEYDFHKLSATRFENLAAFVVNKHFRVPQMLTFADGKDGGRDAAARGVSLNLGSGNTKSNQNLVVQVKHTQNPAGKMDSDGALRRVFLPEVEKVKKLVQENHLDIYIVVTNYSFPAGQEKKLVDHFRNAGAKTVILVGKETLIRWITESEFLRKEIPRQFDVGGPSTHDIAEKTALDVTEVKQMVEKLTEQTNDKNNKRAHETNGCPSDMHSNIKKQKTSQVQLQNRNPDDRIPQHIFVRLSECPGLMDKWRFVARRLKMEEHDIKSIDDYYRRLTEQVFQMLLCWSENFTGTRDEAVRTLSRSLNDNNLKGITEILQAEMSQEKET